MMGGSNDLVNQLSGTEGEAKRISDSPVGEV